MLTNRIVAGLLALALVATAAPARAGSGGEEIFVPGVAAVLVLTFDIVNIA